MITLVPLNADQGIIVLEVVDAFQSHLMNAEYNRTVKAGKTVETVNVSMMMMLTSDANIIAIE